MGGETGPELILKKIERLLFRQLREISGSDRHEFSGVEISVMDPQIKDTTSF